MANETFTVSDLIPASAERIYAAWLDGKEHAAMTGGGATGEGRVGGAFTAWDGYIRGTNVELVPGRRIVQSWRSNDFPDGAADSQVEIKLDPADGGTRITLVHSNVPEGQGADYEKGWREHYFVPMRKYFTGTQPVMPAPLPPPPIVTGPIPMPPADEWETAMEEKTVATPKPKAAPKPKAKVAAKPKAKAAAKPKAKAKTKTKAAAKPKKKIAAKAKAKPKKKAAAKPKKKAAAKPKKAAKKKGARR
jgi:uncharacterized protein YndB with AHSA1/START domain